MKKEKRAALMNEFHSLYNEEKWKKAKKVLMVLLNEESDNFFLWTSLSSVTYELRDYKKALEYSKKAYKLYPESPLVLWDYAAILYVLNKDKKARKKWEQIIEYGEEKVAEITKEGLRWAKRIVNDSRFRLGQSHFYDGNDSKSQRYFDEHLKYRKKGISSLYKKKRVIKYLERIEDSLAEKN